MVLFFIEVFWEYGEIFYFGKGENMRGVVYIDDIVFLFVLIIGKYFDGGDGFDYGKEV